MLPFILGFLFSSFIGLFSYRKGALTNSGVIGAILIGTIIFGFGQEMTWYLLLIIFFVTSSLLSFYRKKDKREVEDTFEKTGKRDVWQALANGGLASILAIIGYFYTVEWVYVAFVAAFATVNADTWATEIGVLSKGKPRYILTGKKVAKGTSGGISFIGSIGAFLGSLLIGVSAFVLLLLKGDIELSNKNLILFLMMIPISGFIGGLADSLLGATVQAMYRCSVCGKETEKEIHCQQPTNHFKGLAWMNNDMVNFISSMVGSGVAVIFFIALI